MWRTRRLNSMETLIFDNATVKAHPIYPDCGASLHDVSKRDYPSDDFLTSVSNALTLTAMRRWFAKNTERRNSLRPMPL